MQVCPAAPDRLAQTSLAVIPSGCSTALRAALAGLALRPGVRAVVLVHDGLRARLVVRYDCDRVTAAELRRAWLVPRETRDVTCLARLLRWGPHAARIALALSRCA